MGNSCTHLKELMKAQILPFEQEVALNQYFLSKKNNKGIDWKEAQEDYLENHFHDWAEGFGDFFCLEVCKESDCSTYYNVKQKLRKRIERHKINLENEFKREVSFEEAKKRYVSTLSPSFWKGIVDALFLKIRL